MKLASRLTYWGSCREAASFYCERLNFRIEEISTYGDVDALGMPVPDECKNLVHNAVLLHPTGFRLRMSDSITLLFSQDQMQIINAGHLCEKGCREGAAMEIFDLSESEITELYDALMENQSIAQVRLAPRDGLKLYASVMDKYNLCWNLSCK